MPSDPLLMEDGLEAWQMENGDPWEWASLDEITGPITPGVAADIDAQIGLQFSIGTGDAPPISGQFFQVPYPPPEDLQAVRSTDGETVVLSCTAVTGATHYQWHRTDGYEGAWTQIAQTAIPTHTDEDLDAQQAYSYSVRAWSDDGQVGGLRTPEVYTAPLDEVLD